MVDTNLFRGDLYFRLSVLFIEIPPLRKRVDDIELLAQHFLNNYCKKMGLQKKIISPDALKFLRQFKWPGNVRQLENAIIYAIYAATNEVIIPENIPASIMSNISENDAQDIEIVEEIENNTIKDFEKEAILKALFKTNNNVARAASILNMGKSTLYKKLKQYDINS